MRNESNGHLYLSRLVLDLNCRQVWSELAHPYEMHRTLMRAFPQLPPQEKTNAREKYGVLFRADVEDYSHRVVVYVQSVVKPCWSFLDGVEGYLLADAEPPNPGCKSIERAYGKLRAGQVLAFRLRANPTKRIWKVAAGEEALKGKRVGLLREEEQVAWLVQKSLERERGKPGGFEIVMKEIPDRNGNIRQIPQVTACCEGKQTGRKLQDTRKHAITHLAVRFDGLLRITDADAFRDTLAKGIGPAKAFGFGLLSVAAV
jgi:CRISPR system Cascade subunit CasE